MGTTRVMTDESVVYDTVIQNYRHETVNNSAKEYVRGDVHVNTAEGFFSQFKRSLDGTHHHVSAKHLHRYVAEFDHRYNAREMKYGERMVQAIQQTTGRRLTYRQPTKDAGTVRDVSIRTLGDRPA